jgi:hypothetical protein
MRKAKKILWAIFFLLPLFVLSSGNALGNPIDDEDDETPDVTARVARISFLRGDAKIKHAGEQDWERVTQNLPVVEGDEISTDGNARLEIQFNRSNYLRLSENAYLKITTLRDEGIAVSLPEGVLSLRVLSFDKDRESFEIDAPRTTVAVQNAGMYRVDAGGKKDSQIRVAVTDGGQARVYTENSGFSLRSGRSAEIQIAGNYAGEYETSDAAKYADEFDGWALQRDTLIAKRLQNAGYDKYYDNDVYGAEDLSEYGEWIHTRKYGYVWKPYSSATNSYANWSPYRYGHWRWIPPYGWTWVNDESWGYATYHHGRWVYVDNDWAWTPYGRYRSRRSWWQPALVVVTYSGSLICWYPLPYDYGYYNYNSAYVDRRRYNTTIINNTTVIANQTTNGTKDRRRKIFDRTPLELGVSPTGVVAVEANEFGKGTRNIRPAPLEVAKKTLSKTPFETENPPLPEYRNLKGKVNREILAEIPRNEQIGMQIKTGATERKIGVQVDENLRKERIYGNRPPVERTPPTVEARENQGKGETRDTGAVKRELRPMPKQEDGNADKKKSLLRETSPDNFPIRSGSGKTNNENEDNQVAKPRNRAKEISPPIYAPQEQPERQERKERRQVPPPSESPQPSEQPSKREQPREAKPPQREQPSPKVEKKVEPPAKEKSETGRPEKIKPVKDN